VLNSDAKIPFTIKVIDSDEVNAFALPGGYFTSIKA
jgi:predicted Zn-dependent protease